MNQTEQHQQRGSLVQIPLQAPVKLAPRYWALRDVVRAMDWDPLQELERLRQAKGSRQSSPIGLSSEQPSVDEDLYQSLAYSSVVTPPMTPPSSRSAYLQPHDVVEDLDLEESRGIPGLLSPVLVLMLWLGSCVAIIWGVGWLIAPGSPERAAEEAEETLVATALEDPSNPSSSVPAVPELAVAPLPDLLSLPLIPVGSQETLAPESRIVEYTDPETGLVVRRILRSNPGGDGVDPLGDVINPLSALTVASSRIRPPVARVAAPRAMAREMGSASRSRLEASLFDPQPLPALASVSITDATDPNRGEGIFLVLMDYVGDQSLLQAREVSEGAFIKDIEGQRYVQLASFDQVEYARFMADSLRQQGIPATVSELF